MLEDSYEQISGEGECNMWCPSGIEWQVIGPVQTSNQHKEMEACNQPNVQPPDSMFAELVGI